MDEVTPSRGAPVRYATDGTPIDLFLDLQGMDETGMPWGCLTDAADPTHIHEGAWITAGTSSIYAVARVIDLVADPTGTIVHIDALPGPATQWLHLLPSRAAS